MPTEKNAIITSTCLGREDHGIMTCWLNLDYGGSAQGFGGYALERATFITKILDTLGVASWEKLPGTMLRVRQDNGRVHAIGHFIKDVWFTPAEDLK